MGSIYRQFDHADLAREYSPSSCVDDIAVFIDAYLDTSNAANRSLEQAGRANFDIHYGPSDTNRLDLFCPAGEPAPLHVYFHGGYWQELGKEYSTFAAPAFVNKGHAFTAIGYTLAPALSLTGIVEECRLALTFLYKNALRLGFDPERIYLSGSSAGAHLAMMMYSTDWAARGLPVDLVKGVCAVSGVFDLEPIRLTYVNDALSLDAEEARLNSPAYQEPCFLAPVVMAYGDNETGEFKRQTDEYCHKLTQAGATVQFREIPDRNHFDVILDLADESSWLMQRAFNLVGPGPGIGC